MMEGGRAGMMMTGTLELFLGMGSGTNGMVTRQSADNSWMMLGDALDTYDPGDHFVFLWPRLASSLRRNAIDGSATA